MNVFRERAALVAFLTNIYPASIAYNDPDEPDWPVVYVETPEGQLSWHIHEDDLDLFNGVDIRRGADAPAWDGHSTDEKYQRLSRLNPWKDCAPTA